MLDPAIEAVLRGGLALLFAVTAFEKARDFGAFRAALDGYALVPQRFVGAVAAALVAGETALALALLAPAAPGLRTAALVACAGLLALYGIAIAVNLVRGRRDIDCGCAGPAARQSLSEWLLARNALLATGALVCLGGATSRPFVWIDALTVVGGVAMLAASWLAVHRLFANAAPLARLQEGR